MTTAPEAAATTPLPTAEADRLASANGSGGEWRNWGPWMSERAWGTVREDYSASGDAWTALSHDDARSTAYRWNEDGLAGICDRDQQLCLAFSSDIGEGSPAPPQAGWRNAAAQSQMAGWLAHCRPRCHPLRTAR